MSRRSSPTAQTIHLRKKTHPRPAPADLQPGQRCAFWKDTGRQKGGARTKSGHYVSGVFCGWDRGLDGRRDSDNAWVRLPEDHVADAPTTSASASETTPLVGPPGEAAALIPFRPQGESLATKRPLLEDIEEEELSTTRRRVDLPISSGSEIDEPSNTMVTEIAAVLITETTAEDDEEALSRHVTRKDQEALEREIPWTAITKMDDKCRDEFEAVAEKEYHNTATRTPAGADLAGLERNSPTPFRLSLMSVLQAYAPGHLTYKRTWYMMCADATDAFL